jgi:hypothetical protein
MPGALGDLGTVCTMRMMPGDIPKVSIMDFVMEVTGQNNDHVGKTIRNLEKENQEFFENLERFKFSGLGQKQQYVLCCSKSVELLMMLPGKRAKQFRKTSAGLLTRLFAGDPTLHDLIEKNGLSENALGGFVDYVQVSSV